METRLSRLSGDGQYGPDNGLQSEVVAAAVVRGAEKEREREEGGVEDGGRDGATGEDGARVAH